MKFKTFVLLFIFSLLSACSIKRSSAPQKTLVGLSSQEIIDQKGQPQSITDGKINTESTIYTYKDESFQIVHDKVTTHFRAPEHQEVKLQYWMQKWQQVYEKRVLENPNDTHHTSDSFLVEYRSKEKTSVIYDKDADLVVRVVYYE